MSSSSMFYPALVLSLVLLTTACQHSSSNGQTRCYEDGKPKPSVALIPVINSADQSCAWDLSDELTSSIQHRLKLRDKVFLSGSDASRFVFYQLDHQHNPFGIDIEWTKESCRDQDFVVFMELIEHDEIPVRTHQEDDPSLCSADLNISMRVRVIDLRGLKPRVVLQEILHDSHHIPRQFTKYHFYQEPWGKESFAISPMGLAHAQLVKEVASRVEEYIMTAKGL